MFATFIAGILSAPLLSDKAAQELVREFPSNAIRKNLSAAALLSVWVSPDGKVYACELIGFVGDRGLAENYPCSNIRRKRLTPAKDREGRKVHGQIVTMVRYLLPGSKHADAVAEAQQSADVTIPWNGPESEVRKDYMLRADVHVRQDGTVDDCSVSDHSAPEFSVVVCDRLMSASFPVGLDRDGKPVPYVRNLEVRFAIPDID